MLRRLLATSNDSIPLIARVVLGLVILPHALQKTLGLFGGYGLEGTLGFMTSQGIPLFFAVLAIVAETAGGLGLVLGLFGRIASFGVASVLIVAALLVHRNHFFMNWSGTQGGEGYEYHLLALTLAAIVLVRGSGRWSLDRLLLKASTAPRSLGAPLASAYSNR
ncbi:MAG: DoxX family protein [Gemmatimonadota bacterium]